MQNNRSHIKALENFTQLKHDLESATGAMQTKELTVTDFTVGNKLTEQGALPASFDRILLEVVNEELPALMVMAVDRAKQRLEEARKGAREECCRVLAEEAVDGN